MTAVSAGAAPQRVTRATPAGDHLAAPSIGVLYPSGWGNLGDEAILQVTFENLRKRWPRASLRAFTLHPARTAANHDVEAEPLTGVNRHLFGAPLGEGPLLMRLGRGLARRVQGVPFLGRVASMMSELLATMVFETISLRRAWSWLRNADLVIASGGGQLDAAWGGAWGQPYALARWAWLAKRAGVPFALHSVGYGSTPSWLSRRFLRYAIASARYCSLRDAGSLEMIGKLGLGREFAIVPDLAFGLSAGAALPPRRPGHDIGISPMVYLRPGSWPVEDLAGYRRLIGLWAELTSAIVANGDRAHLFVSNPGDMPAVNDVSELLDPNVRASCTVNCPQTPNALLDLYQGMDAVISSRLHGVLLAIVASKPVLALSHERKVRAAMHDAGIPEYALDLTAATPTQTLSVLDVLQANLEPCSDRLREYVAKTSCSLRRQDDLLPQMLKGRE